MRPSYGQVKSYGHIKSCGQIRSNDQLRSSGLKVINVKWSYFQIRSDKVIWSKWNYGPLFISGQERSYGQNGIMVLYSYQVRKGHMVKKGQIVIYSDKIR